MILSNRILRVVFFLFFSVAGGFLPARAGDDWQPVSPDELKMTSEPKAPGAPAIFLYRQVDRDDIQNREVIYARIKILTEEGRKYGDVELPFIKGQENIRNIKARTIRPDGSIANFEGKPYEKTVVKARGVSFLAKTFTLPDVQVGSIIEYRYAKDWDRYALYNSRWILSEELFTRDGKFSLKPYAERALHWMWPVGLPAGSTQPKMEGQLIRMEARNVPAFLVEDFMPPENTLKFRVDFLYTGEHSPEKDPEKFWKQWGKTENEDLESFVGKRGAIRAAAAQMTAPDDPPEVKLPKIYARVQQIRNLSFEKEKSEQEERREKRKDVYTIEDVWKHQSGGGREITWLFLGLARAAGFDASGVLVSRRSEYFFNKSLMNPKELNDNVVLVKLNGKDLYFDPGTALAPYGYLPWGETWVPGLKLDKTGGTWVEVPAPASADSFIERKAQLKMSDDGTLEGKLSITFQGLEAFDRRMDMRNEDEAARKKYLEDQVREYIPVGIEVELTSKPEWASSSPQLQAVFDLKVPGWVNSAGRMALLPVALFGGTEKHLFEHASRTYPVYFPFPFQKTDDVSIELPLGWKVKTLPPAQNMDAKALAYTLSAEDKGGTLHITRFLRNSVVMVQKEEYGALRGFFQMVRTGDELQVVLQPGR